MITNGVAAQLRDGDVLIIDDDNPRWSSRWPIRQVEHCQEGIRLHVDDTPFPWLFAAGEAVRFARPQPTARSESAR